MTKVYRQEGPLSPAKAPCGSCPYRKDVPSGVWSAKEYVALPKYDGDIGDQLANNAVHAFMCHQNDGHLCAGWVGCHGAGNLLALRLVADDVTPETWDYESPVELFASGREACDHGVREIGSPGPKAKAVVRKLMHKRTLPNYRNPEIVEHENDPS